MPQQRQATYDPRQPFTNTLVTLLTQIFRHGSTATDAANSSYAAAISDADDAAIFATNDATPDASDAAYDAISTSTRSDADASAVSAIWIQVEGPSRDQRVVKRVASVTIVHCVEKPSYHTQICHRCFS